MPGSREFLTRDFGEDPCLGADPNPWHGIQEHVQRMVCDQFNDTRQHGGSGLPGLGEHAGQFGQDDAGGLSTRDDHGLGSQSCADVLGPALPRPWCVLAQQGSDAGFSGMANCRRCRVVDQQFGHGRVDEVLAENCSSAGWIWVSRPLMLLEVAVAALARSSSNLQSIDSSATWTSGTSAVRKVWGMVREASAMMNSSLGSPLASPGGKYGFRVPIVRVGGTACFG